jgi:glutathione peroxidase
MKKPLIAALALAALPLVAADTVHDFKVKNIKGEDIDLSSYKGKVLLIVNVASKCGATPQYDAEKGLVVLGFPANNFGAQEPGTDAEIADFCTSNYSVEFPMFSKVSVKGDDKAPLFTYLTSAENPDKQGDIGWNFEKFLIGKDGKLIRRFATRVQPDDATVVAAIEEALAK